MAINIKIISTNQEGIVEKKTISNSDTNAVIKTVGDDFKRWLINTTSTEVKKNNPKWRLD